MTLNLREEVRPGYYAINGQWAGYTVEAAIDEVKNILPTITKDSGAKTIEYVQPIFEEVELRPVQNFLRDVTLDVYANASEWVGYKINLVKMTRDITLRGLRECKEEVDADGAVFVGRMSSQVARVLQFSLIRYTSAKMFAPTLYGREVS